MNTTIFLRIDIAEKALPGQIQYHVSAAFSAFDNAAAISEDFQGQYFRMHSFLFFLIIIQQNHCFVN